MSKILITTQYRENYGTEDEPYWKNKGGGDYFIKGFTGSYADATSLVMAVRDRIEYSDSFSSETIIGFDIVSDDYMTSFEKSQLAYDGKITYPAKTLEIA